ncbi:hypothetical protein HanPSC8_Chr09g0378571 [Helianthus annuus]|nr:hypothetical protein HanPSC8_Chr09g0378571 [Helianthus annuus]
MGHTHPTAPLETVFHIPQTLSPKKLTKVSFYILKRQSKIIPQQKNISKHT